MKNIFTLLLLLFLANNVYSQKLKTNQKALIKTTLNCDHCKECETCGLRFKTEILKIKGLKMYELDYKTSTFTVYFNEKKSNLQTIKIAISKLGYDADEVKATLKGIESLDECCKV